ncbi:MAG TPA: hypothetical protein PKH77_21365 [Anaerolineae bacterium]|nr:hypothetical protein [Anaerolineae bacterium]
MKQRTATPSTIGIMTGQIITKVGSGVLWDSFFALLDTHFAAPAKTLPILRKELCKGQVKQRHAPQAMDEVNSE